MDSQKDQFLKIYEDFSDAIFRHCYFRVSDRELARDLTQETFVKTWDYIVKGKAIANMKSFLYRVATNLIIDNARKEKEISLESLKESGRVYNDPVYEDRFPKQIEAQSMIKILDNLDRFDKNLVIMRFIDELSPSEISEITGQSENAVSVRIHRAIKKIQSLSVK